MAPQDISVRLDLSTGLLHIAGEAVRLRAAWIRVWVTLLRLKQTQPDRYIHIDEIAELLGRETEYDDINSLKNTVWKHFYSKNSLVAVQLSKYGLIHSPRTSKTEEYRLTTNNCQLEHERLLPENVRLKIEKILATRQLEGNDEFRSLGDRLRLLDLYEMEMVAPEMLRNSSTDPRSVAITSILGLHNNVMESVGGVEFLEKHHAGSDWHILAQASLNIVFAHGDPLPALEDALTKNSPIQADLLLRAAWLCMLGENKDLEKAEGFLQQALPLSQNMLSLSLAHRCYTALAWLHKAKNAPEQAKEALQQKSRLNALDKIVLAWIEPAEASQHLEGALLATRRNGQQLYMAWVYLALADNATSKDEKLEYLSKAENTLMHIQAIDAMATVVEKKLNLLRQR